MSDGRQFMDKVANYARKNAILVYFLDGNHDKTSLLLEKYGNSPDHEGFLRVRNWILYSPRGHRWVWDEVSFISLGGAYSVDKDYRIKVLEAQGSGKPERYWFPEEEMTGLQSDVIAQIEELSTLVGDLVDLTRDDAGVTVHEPVEMAEVVDRSLERVRRRRNDIDFDVDIAGWQVYGDGAGLSRAVLNLLDNAAKWSPPGGTVRVQMRPIDQWSVLLEVADASPGIAEQDLPRVFDRF